MPRYDDRLDNVLELMSSDEHSNSDTIFRHISDILLQEGTWMAPERRGDVVYHLASIYPKTTQSARMEVMDIAARVQDAPPELIAIAAADGSILGTRLWDRVSLPREDWPAMLKRLPKPALGRLRARLDLPDETTVAIDREWRERVKTASYQAPNLNATLDELKDRRMSIPETDSDAAFAAPPATDESADEDILDLSQTGISDAEKDDAKAMIFVPSEGDASQDTAEAGNDTAREEDPIDMTVLFDDAEIPSDPIEDKDGGNEAEQLGKDEINEAAKEEPGNTAIPADVITLSDHRRADVNEADLQDLEGLEYPSETEEDEEESASFALGENPQVEDPKIQDILERLREFGSRSKRAAERETEIETETRDDLAAIAALFPGAAGENQTNEEAPQVDAPLQGAGHVTLFMPVQPDDAPFETPNVQTKDMDGDDVETQEGDDDPTQQDGEQQRQILPLSVIGTTWVTDRLGSLVECNTAQDTAFGLPLEDLEGQILSSLFVANDQNALDQALHSRRSFRDRSMRSREDETTWTVSAVPVFDDMTGVFLGHRGTATHVSIARQDAGETRRASAPQPAKTFAFDVEGLAHELKTPLNAIRGFAEMIETEQLGSASAFARDRSKKISQEADQLNSVISDLLLPKMREKATPNNRYALVSTLNRAFEAFSSHLTIDGLPDLSPDLTTAIEPALLETMIEKIVNASALWTPASRNVKIDMSHEDKAAVTLQTTLPGWMGGGNASDLPTLIDGPRLSYRHPLLGMSFKGRGLSAILGEVQDAGARIFLRGPGRLEASLVLVIPVDVAAN